MGIHLPLPEPLVSLMSSVLLTSSGISQRKNSLDTAMHRQSGSEHLVLSGSLHDLLTPCTCFSSPGNDVSEAPSTPSQSFVTPFLNQKRTASFYVWEREASEGFFCFFFKVRKLNRMVSKCLSLVSGCRYLGLNPYTGQRHLPWDPHHPVLPPQGTWHSTLLLLIHGFPLDLELRRSRGNVCFHVVSLASRAALET